MSSPAYEIYVSETIGMLLVAQVLFDVFQTIIVPRITPRTLRLAPTLMRYFLWPACVKTARKIPRFRNTILELYAPLAFIGIMTLWLILLILGFAFILYGLRTSVTPNITSFHEAFYFAGTSVLTLGFGDVVALGIRARLVVLAAATSGLMFMALQVSYLFSLQSLVQQREQLVNTIISRAGAPASGLVLLLRYKELNILPVLYSNFLQWETWIAGILESHRAYPLLLFFRPSNNSDSWISVVGAMLDASALMTSAIKDISTGESELFYWLACSTVKSICKYMDFKVDETEILSFEEFAEGLALLRSAGYETRDDKLAWRLFKVRRTGYLQYVRALADYFEQRPPNWIHELAISQISVKDSVSDSVFQPQV